MAKLTIEFNTYEDQDDLYLAVNANSFYYVLVDLRDWLLNQEAQGSENDYTKVLETIDELMSENRLHFI